MSLAACIQIPTNDGCVDIYNLLLSLHQKVRACEHLPSEQRDELYLELNEMIQKKIMNEKRLKEIQELMTIPVIQARVCPFNESDKQTTASRAIQKMLNL